MMQRQQQWQHEWLDKNNTKWQNTEEIIKDAYARKDWDTLFKGCHRLCYASMLKMLKNKASRTDVDELVLDATIRVVNQIKKNRLYDSPVTQCYFSALAILRNNKQIFQDKIITFTDAEWMETKNEKKKY